MGILGILGSLTVYDLFGWISLGEVLQKISQKLLRRNIPGAKLDILTQSLRKLTSLQELSL